MPLSGCGVCVCCRLTAVRRRPSSASLRMSMPSWRSPRASLRTRPAAACCTSSSRSLSSRPSRVSQLANLKKHRPFTLISMRDLAYINYMSELIVFDATAGFCFLTICCMNIITIYVCISIVNSIYNVYML